MNLLFLVICFISCCLGYSEEGKISILQTSNDALHEIEIFTQKSEKENAPFLLFLHGAASDNGLSSIARSWYDYWVNKGYHVGAISMPGYGKSSGPKDFCGPLTMSVLNYAVDAMKKAYGISSIGMIGFGQGGQAGLLLAAQRDDIRCLVCSNGGYDLLRHLHPEDSLMQTLISKNYALGINEEEFKIRSPIEQTLLINTPIFILHRDANPIIHVDEITDFAKAMTLVGKECIVSILPKSPEADVQKISYQEILQETERWVDTKMNLFVPVSVPLPD